MNFIILKKRKKNQKLLTGFCTVLSTVLNMLFYVLYQLFSPEEKKLVHVTVWRWAKKCWMSIPFKKISTLFSMKIQSWNIGMFSLFPIAESITNADIPKMVHFSDRTMVLKQM